MAHLAKSPNAETAQQAPSAARLNVILFLVTLSVLINYIDRSNLSIAAPLLKDELRISASQLGTLLSAFFWIYALMQMPVGWLVDRLDVKWVFAVGFLLWSAATAVTGVLHGFSALLVIRVILGIGESVTFPSCGKIIGTYFRENRRGFANSMLSVGLSLGPALGVLVGGTAVARFGWRPFFIALGLIGMLWLPFWIAGMPAREAVPHAHFSHKAGYVDILRQRSAWGTGIGLASLNYCLYFLVTWLPFYLVRGRGFSLTQMARAGGLVFLMSALSSSFIGKLSDHWVLTGGPAVRKNVMFFGHTGLGFSFLFTVVSHGTLFFVMLAVTGMFLGIFMSNCWAISQILAGPHMVGRWVGLQNFVGNVGGAVAPVLTGLLLDRTGSFYWPFFITAVVAWIGGVGWRFVVGPLEEVNWEEARRPSCSLPIASAAELP